MYVDDVRNRLTLYRDTSGRRMYRFITIYPHQDPVPENKKKRVEQVALACAQIDEARKPGKIIQPADNQRPRGDWRLDRNVSTWISIRFGSFSGSENVYNYATGKEEQDNWRQPFPNFLSEEAEMPKAQLKTYGFTVTH